MGRAPLRGTRMLVQPGSPWMIVKPSGLRVRSIMAAGCWAMSRWMRSLDVGRAMDGLASGSQLVGAPPAGVHGREPVGKGQGVLQSGWTSGRLDMGGADIVAEQVVAVLRRGVGGIVAADQRCTRDINIVAGVVGDLRVAERLVVINV